MSELKQTNDETVITAVYVMPVEVRAALDDLRAAIGAVETNAKAEVDRLVNEWRHLITQVSRLDMQMKTLHHIVPTMNEHDDRLDEHDRQIAHLDQLVSDVRAILQHMGVELGRVGDAATATGLSTERMERRLIQDRSESDRNQVALVERDMALQQMLGRMLEMLQPKVTLPTPAELP